MKESPTPAEQYLIQTGTLEGLNALSGAVFDLIARELRQGEATDPETERILACAKEAITAEMEQLKQQLAQMLEASVNPATIDAVLTFFGSPVGQRFAEMQHVLSAVTAKASQGFDQRVLRRFEALTERLG